MEKSQVFELILVLLLACGGALWYLMTSAASAPAGWEIAANGTLDYMLIGSNDTLYVFQGNNVSAILPNGSLKWRYTVPDRYRVINSYSVTSDRAALSGYSSDSVRSYPVVEESNGSLYLFALRTLNGEDRLRFATRQRIDLNSTVLALSPDGVEKWEYPLAATSPTISAAGDRILIYHDHEEEVLALNGTKLFTIDDLAGSVTVTEAGELCGVKTTSAYTHDSYIDLKGTTVLVENSYEVSAQGLSAVSYIPDGSLSLEIVLESESSSATELLTAIARNCSGRMEVYHDDSSDDWMNGTLLGTYEEGTPHLIAFDTGEIYRIRAIKTTLDDDTTVYREATPQLAGRDTAVVTSGNVVGYDSEGRLLWSTDLGEPVTSQGTSESTGKQYQSLPLYRNGTLYAFVSNGVAALDPAGHILWTRHLVGGQYEPFSLMPIDSAGNIYMQLLNDQLAARYITSISPQGQVFPDAWTYKMQYDVYGRTGMGILPGFTGTDDLASEPLPIAGGDGIVYTIGRDLAPDNISFATLLRQPHIPSDTLTAYDIRTGSVIWNFTIPAVDRHVFTLGQNASEKVNGSSIYETVRMMTLDPETGHISSLAYWQAGDKSRITVCPSNNVTYIYYDYLVYDAGTSYVYRPANITGNGASEARGLYAVDRRGQLLWQKTVIGDIDRIVANNSTIYYSTSDGRLGGAGAGIAAGITVLALAYLFLKFFVLGTVARARSRLDQNENRTAILRFISENPGATMADVTKALGLNIGTIRYHLLVLTLNHRISDHQDSKFIRYFPAVSAYGEVEKSALSLVRRMPIARVLNLLAARPGLSNKELAWSLGISTAAAHEQVTELLGRGVLTRSKKSDGEYGYSIRDEYSESILRALEKT